MANKTSELILLLLFILSNVSKEEFLLFINIITPSFEILTEFKINTQS